MTQVLITGGEGQLGRSLAARAFFHPGLNLHFFDLPELDIRDTDTLAFIIKELNISLVLNSAAFTAVDLAESEVEMAYAVNAEAVGTMSLLLRELGIPLIHISTDYVFDGNGSRPYPETDSTGPSSVYGQSKLAGEEAMLRSGVDGLIIRTSWLYSEFGKNFLKTMLRLADERSELKVVADQYGSPTYAGDLAEAILRIAPVFERGKGSQIYHYCNQGQTNWHGFASEIMLMTGKDCKVLPIGTAEYPTPAKRPAYSVLDCTKIRQDFNLLIPTWQDGLRRCLESMDSID